MKHLLIETEDSYVRCFRKLLKHCIQLAEVAFDAILEFLDGCPGGHGIRVRHNTGGFRPRKKLAQRGSLLARLAFRQNRLASFSQAQVGQVQRELTLTSAIEQLHRGADLVVGRRCIGEEPVGLDKDVRHAIRSSAGEPPARRRR